MKNKKGFATSTVLYGLFALFVLIIMLTFQLMKTNSRNTKDVGSQIEKEYQACVKNGIKYNACVGTTCSSGTNNEMKIYTDCLKTKR